MGYQVSANTVDGLLTIENLLLVVNISEEDSKYEYKYLLTSDIFFVLIQMFNIAMIFFVNYYHGSVAPIE